MKGVLDSFEVRRRVISEGQARAGYFPAQWSLHQPLERQGRQFHQHATLITHVRRLVESQYELVSFDSTGRPEERCPRADETQQDLHG